MLLFLLPPEGEHANLYDFLTTVVTLIVVRIITAWITKRNITPTITANKNELTNKLEEVRKETTAAKVAAVDAVAQTVVGNNQLEEVHRAVNGDKDKLVRRVAELEQIRDGLEAQLAGRRMGENR